MVLSSQRRAVTCLLIGTLKLELELDLSDITDISEWLPP